MGRRKLLPIYIADKGRRRQTFLKRKKGLFKKARELSVLCGGRVFMRIHDPENAKDYSQQEFDGSSFLHPQHNHAIAFPVQMDQFAAAGNFNGVNPTISNYVPVQVEMDQRHPLPVQMDQRHPLPVQVQMDQRHPLPVQMYQRHPLPVQVQMDQRHPQFLMSEQAKANLSSTGELQNDQDPPTATPSILPLPLPHNCTSQQEDDGLPLLQLDEINEMLDLLQEDPQMMFNDLSFPDTDRWPPQ
ncbi:MADS-box MEF2 type transcription factor MIG1-like [Cryptomeria japonica]|uniref:MADS-box MEF2 type transcription factor MIG1 n=1 Tax=Cryptomeria japonica TaxID=3369 RepID=UPI0025AC6187|nr:MADS-box MEF2 type transcription factor MIG1 [Cryptomeria japonica]XP_057851877.2 MADS-box MEF2 type transcription factor MIG1-like [Cryptomeria japonica]